MEADIGGTNVTVYAGVANGQHMDAGCVVVVFVKTSEMTRIEQTPRRDRYRLLPRYKQRRKLQRQRHQLYLRHRHYHHHRLYRRMYIRVFCLVNGDGVDVAKRGMG